MTNSLDQPLVVNCPRCMRVMWAGSTACGYCRAMDGQPDKAAPKETSNQKGR